MRMHAIARLAITCVALVACQSEPTASIATTIPTLGTPLGEVSAADCLDCVFGPTTYTRVQGPPQLIQPAPFTATAGARYTVDIDDLGSQGSDGSVVLNGVTLMAKRALGEVGPRHVVVEVTLGASNTLEIRLSGKKASLLQVSVRPVCFVGLPNPVLVLQSITPRVIGGFNRNEYALNVSNSASFPDALFARSPELPACGLNTSASRSFVEIFVDNVRVFGFCALPDADALNSIYFVRDPALPPPTSAYIQINDRKCNVTYQSDPITLPPPPTE